MKHTCTCVQKLHQSARQWAHIWSVVCTVSFKIWHLSQTHNGMFVFVIWKDCNIMLLDAAFIMKLPVGTCQNDPKKWFIYWIKGGMNKVRHPMFCFLKGHCHGYRFKNSRVQKHILRQRKPTNTGPVLIKITIPV